MTVGRAHLLIYDHSIDRRKQLRCNINLQRLTGENASY